MPRRSLCLFPLLVFLACSNAASADSDSNSRAVENVSAKGFDQLVYKGLVGNALDGIPMDPSKRVSLQRTNAVVSNTLSGRSLAILAGLSNPILLIGGFVWGIWSASNIKPEEDVVKAHPGPDRGDVQLVATNGVLLDRAPAAPETIAAIVPETARPTSLSSGAADEPLRASSYVVKVWLPQRSPTLAAVDR